MKSNLLKRITAGALSAACCCTFAAAGCGGGGTEDPEPSETTTYTITFDYNYDGSTSTTQTVAEGGTVTKPSDPERDSHEFTGWYTTSAATGTQYDFTTTVTSDFTLYAGWNELVYYTVTFDYNYDGSTAATQSVSAGETVSEPTEPTRDGYYFLGWYTDESGDTAYDFTTAVEGDVTLYASWGAAGDVCLVTFYLNDGTDTVYDTAYFTYNKWITKPSVNPSRDGYYFDGWYTDESGETAFNFNNRYTSDQNVYAKWRMIYTFEAEYTKLDGKFGRGYSGQNSGLGLITADNTENGTASNGYYVGWLYYEGASLEFEFESDTDASDVTIVLRLSAEYDDLSVSGDEIIIKVNDEAQYNVEVSIEAYDIYEMNDYGVKDFANYVIASGVSVKQGSNVIQLYINNSNQGSGATMKASAPLVDCMYLYTNASLTLTEYKSNISG